VKKIPFPEKQVIEDS